MTEKDVIIDEIIENEGKKFWNIIAEFIGVSYEN